MTVVKLRVLPLKSLVHAYAWAPHRGIACHAAKHYSPGPLLVCVGVRWWCGVETACSLLVHTFPILLARAPQSIDLFASRSQKNKWHFMTMLVLEFGAVSIALAVAIARKKGQQFERNQSLEEVEFRVWGSLPSPYPSWSPSHARRGNRGHSSRGLFLSVLVINVSLRAPQNLCNGVWEWLHSVRNSRKEQQSTQMSCHTLSV